MPSEKTSVLINDLNSVPNIISNLGLGIAAAQKAFNLDYLNSLERLFAMAKSLRGSDDADSYKEILNDIIKAMAPPKYQFTETTFTVRMDLAQSLQSGTTAGLGVSVGAVTLNAAITKGFAYDYRAAAEVKTLITATNFDTATFNALLGRAKELTDKTLTIPKQVAVDTAYIEKSQELYNKLTDQVAGQIIEEPKK